MRWGRGKVRATGRVGAGGIVTWRRIRPAERSNVREYEPVPIDAPLPLHARRATFSSARPLGIASFMGASVMLEAIRTGGSSSSTSAGGGYGGYGGLR